MVTMTRLEFNQILDYPNRINAGLSEKLNLVVETYPYFQSARILYLKGLQNQESFKFNDTLKKTAAYVTDRSVLFDFIAEKKETIPPKDKTNIQTLHKDIGKQKKEEIKNSLEIGKPLVFNFSEKHSFNEWLQLKQLKPIKREKSKISPFDLIDKFIQANPKIKPSKSQEKTSILDNGIQENSDIMTETLAKVYLEQKKYEKAITAYKILSLKYPEKSGFFADRIKAIKILQKKQ